MRSTVRARLACAAIVALLLAACGGGDGGNGAVTDDRGTVVEHSQTSELTRAQIDESLQSIPGALELVGGNALCDVSLRRIVYRTIGPRGERVLASAGLLIPGGCAAPYPVLLYHHGTSFDRAYTTSDPENGEMRVMAAAFAAKGYVVAMPDYHGYGRSDLGYHPYLQAESTATASIDALRAVRSVLAERAVRTSAKLFLAGYSQGGHATMATQRAMERDHAGEFEITASMPMSGPYSITQTFLSALDGRVAGSAAYVAMALTGFQRSYGDVYASVAQAFRAPYAARIEGLLPSSSSVSQLEAQGLLPPPEAGVTALLTDAFAATLRGEPQSPARRRAAENDLLEWTPRAPTALCGGSRDPVVPFENTRLAAASFARRGAAVPAIDIEQDPRFDFIIAIAIGAAPDLSTYHGGIAAALCLYTAKNDFFDPRIR